MGLLHLLRSSPHCSTHDSGALLRFSPAQLLSSHRSTITSQLQQSNIGLEDSSWAMFTRRLALILAKLASMERQSLEHHSEQDNPLWNSVFTLQTPMRIAVEGCTDVLGSAAVDRNWQAFVFAVLC